MVAKVVVEQVHVIGSISWSYTVLDTNNVQLAYGYGYDTAQDALHGASFILLRAPWETVDG